MLSGSAQEDSKKETPFSVGSERPIENAICSINFCVSLLLPDAFLCCYLPGAFPVACVRTRTETIDATEPRNELIALHPVLVNGYIQIEMMAEARPRLKKSHIILYAGESQDFFNKGTTEIKFPRTVMTLLCMRYQKSASLVLPAPLLGGVTFIDMENALYPGTIAIARKMKLRPMRKTVS